MKKKKKKSDDEADGAERENGARGEPIGEMSTDFSAMRERKAGGGKVGRQRPHFPDAPTWKIAAPQLPSNTNYEISSVSSNEGYFRGERRDRCSVKSWDTVTKRDKDYFSVRNVEVKAQSFMDSCTCILQ